MRLRKGSAQLNEDMLFERYWNWKVYDYEL